MKEIILRYFLPAGYILNPKSDGRIEIPQAVVKHLGWNLLKEINYESDIGRICLFENESKASIKVADGRIRLSLNLLKKAEINNRELCLVINSDGFVIYPKLNFEGMIDFVSSLNEVQVKNLSSILMGQEVKDDKAELILPDSPMVFKITGGPYVFPAERDGKNIFFKEGGEEFFLVPGIQIKKNDNRYGFLVLSKETFKLVKNIVLNAKKDFVEIILLYDSFVAGGFKVYNNPPTELPNEEIVKSQSVCKDPKKFIDENFNRNKGE